jgi:hypothetical protein
MRGTPRSCTLSHSHWQSWPLAATMAWPILTKSFESTDWNVQTVSPSLRTAVEILNLAQEETLFASLIHGTPPELRRFDTRFCDAITAWRSSPTADGDVAYYRGFCLGTLVHPRSLTPTWLAPRHCFNVSTRGCLLSLAARHVKPSSKIALLAKRNGRYRR